LFDSIDRLLSMKEGLNKVCEELLVPEFTERELEFLEEFQNVSKPIAYALDLLQGENGLFMGVTLPSLKRMNDMLLNMKNTTKFCNKFVEACLNGVEKPFGELLKVDPTSPSDLVYAAMSHPGCKLRWLPSELHDNLKQCFVKECQNYAKPTEPEVVISSAAVLSPINPLLDFSGLDDNSSTSNFDYNVELECVQFFKDTRTALDMLKDYPTIFKAFLRFNTPLPSSAPVERLFSSAGLVLSPRRCSLGDKRFEKLVFLKCNSKYQV